MNKESSRDFFRRFQTPGVKRYVFGINEYADNIASQFHVDGFIDEFTKESHHKGRPVFRLSDIPTNAMVVSAVTSARPRTSLERLRANDITDTIDYFSFADASAGKVNQVPAISGMQIDFYENTEAYKKLRASLADEQSIEVFDSTLQFKLNCSIDSLNSYSCRIDQQYFEPFVNLNPDEVFVDGGGFDGFTTLQFIKKCPSYKSVHFFEPSQANLNIAMDKLNGAGRIHYHKIGLYDARAVLHFDSKNGSGSRISESGADQILVDTLDDAVSERVSFIKLDLEGAEPNALLGMRRHIIEDHPKIAVAVYHEPSHLRMIPEIILGFRKDYKIYLRHYTESWTETIMFFIPEGKS